MSIDVRGKNNVVARCDCTYIKNLHLVQQQSEFTERLVAPKIKVAQAAPSAMRGSTVATCVASCPCSGPDLERHRVWHGLPARGRRALQLTTQVTLLLAAASFNLGFGFLPVHAGVPAGNVHLAGTGTGAVVVASLVLVGVTSSASRTDAVQEITDERR